MITPNYGWMSDSQWRAYVGEQSEQDDLPCESCEHGVFEHNATGGCNECECELFQNPELKTIVDDMTDIAWEKKVDEWTWLDYALIIIGVSSLANTGMLIWFLVH